MNGADILRIALRQSAIDCSCSTEDFLSGGKKVVISRPNPDARRYLTLPFQLDLVSYGSGIVAAVSPEFETIAAEYINKFPPEHCFETPNLHVLNEALWPFGQKICFMAEYFLPDVQVLQALPCDFDLKILHGEDFKELYIDQWSNALCKDTKDSGS